MTINKRRLIDYTILLLFIASSGFPYFTTPAVYITELTLLILIFLSRRKSFDPYAIAFFLLLAVLTLLQTAVFDFFAPITTLGLFARVLSAYFIVKILDIRFTEYYVKTLYILSILSFAVYIPTLIIPSIGTALLNLTPLFQWLNPDSKSQNILIYTLSHLSSLRNSGPFWEPGAFAGYLIIAFIFSYTKTPKLFNKQNLVLLITILSTLSTTAFLALFVFLFFANYVHMKNIFIKIVAVSLIIFGSYQAFFSLDFLGKKITEQIERAQTSSIETDQNSQRFLNILRDMKDLQDHETVGRGSNSETRFSFGPKDQIRTVGLTDVLVKFGIPFFILILYMLYQSISRFAYAYLEQKNVLYNAGIFITLLITLMSEVYFNFPMYWSLLFLMFIYKIPRRTS